ncbi:MAG: peroxiredoxin family protein [Pseudomonadales bacterium]|nr:peroxiredoxin family protein [Halioglobus sp.]MCP5192450.1 peroxiredoxin family protein [Pseudomonadales bacterium]
MLKKSLIALSAGLVIAVALGYLLREPLREFLYARLTADMFVAQDVDDFDPGPALGSRFPGIRAHYQGRQLTLVEEFAGPRGTVFIASRSLDWCPYCMRQMIQLQQYSADFTAAGIGMVAITYDTPRLQQAFIDRFGITIPVLSDIDGLSFKTLGILNTEYRQGDVQYGIPYPGMIVIDPNGVVVGKVFLEAYSSRVDSAAALAFAKAVLKIE